MARPLQKKKNKSSRPRIRQKTKSKRINIKSNPIVAANWNSTLTLSQNYHRLGLSSKLNSHSGGTEKTSPSYPPREESTAHGKGLGLAIPSSRAPKTLGTEEVKVVRDMKTGAIISVQDSSRESRERKNPLNDPLNSDDDADEVAENGAAENGAAENGARGGRGEGMIVAELEESARYERKKRPRQQSGREREWCERLVRRWGDDWGGMSRDRRLNPMQQSEGDLRRRVELWKRREGVGRGEVEVED